MVHWWVLWFTVAHVSGYIKYKKLMILVFEDTVLCIINSCPYFFRELAVPQKSLIPCLFGYVTGLFVLPFRHFPFIGVLLGKRAIIYLVLTLVLFPTILKQINN